MNKCQSVFLCPVARYSSVLVQHLFNATHGLGSFLKEDFRRESVNSNMQPSP